jgi:hypothetical protein
MAYFPIPAPKTREKAVSTLGNLVRRADLNPEFPQNPVPNSRVAGVTRENHLRMLAIQQFTLNPKILGSCFPGRFR